MSKRISLSFLMLLSASFVFAQKDFNARFFNLPPYQRFQDSVRKYLVYPETAIDQGITGTVHVAFKVNEDGFIIPQTVTIVSGLSKSCDEEALRVVKDYKGSFNAEGLTITPGLPLIAPLQFLIRGADVTVDRPHGVKPFKAIIGYKGSKDVYPNWSVYPTVAMDAPIKNVLPGDTVEVSGWGAWTFFISNRFTSGYISYRALTPSPSIDSLIKVIEEKSPNEIIPPPRPKPVIEPTYDTTRIFKNPHAYFVVTSSKKAISVGECTTLSVAFHVREENINRLQFWNLGEQVNSLLPKMDFPNFIKLSHQVNDITGVSRSDSGGNFTEYAIVRSDYCATKTTQLTVPPLKLKMLIYKDARKKESSIIKFESSPVTVTVSPALPGGGAVAFGRFKLFGDYTLKDSVSSSTVEAGQPFQYVATITSNAPTFLIEPPQFTIPGMQIQLSQIKDSLNMKESGLVTTKTFIYNCIADMPGVYDFKNKISLSYYNPESKTNSTLSSKITVEAKATALPRQRLEHKYFFDKDLLIAIDVSQSMQIEDYPPTRLEAIKKGLKQFASRNDMCKIGIIVFGANFKHLPFGDGKVCYSAASIDGINHDMLNGTAIGDAIWFGSVSARKGVPAKLVIIGDGDNTAGYLSSDYAAQFAKSKGIKVYTIGVGNRGPVPYGRDERGQPYMIENTFSDKDFKLISAVTAAQYSWAKDADEVAKALEKFLLNK